MARQLSIIVEQMVTVDGFAAEPDGGLRFAEATEPRDLTDHDQLAMLESVDAIVLGRRTYEMFAAYWPTRDPAEEGVAEPINRLPKLVVSSTLERAPWGGAGDDEIEVLRPDPTAADAVAGLAGRFGTVIVWGSLQLADALLEAGLVTRLRLRTCPAVIGDGLRFTPPALGLTLLRLESSTSLPSGHVVSEYALGGA